MNPALHGKMGESMKMNGVFVKISSSEFQDILNKQDGLMIIMTKAGLFNDVFTYLTSYKGFIFYCKSEEQITLPGKHEFMFSSSVTLPLL